MVHSSNESEARINVSRAPAKDRVARMRRFPPVMALLALFPPLAWGAAPPSKDPRGCVAGPGIVDLFGCPNDGRIYRDSLVAALESADRVVITEHSDPWDLGSAKNRDLADPNVEYRRVVLDADQRAFFRKTMMTMNPATQDWASACMPVVHHTVRFEQAGRVSGTLRICFQCSQVFWDGAEVSPPNAIYRALEAVVKNVGLEPEREWRRLAWEAKSAENSAAD